MVQNLHISQKLKIGIKSHSVSIVRFFGLEHKTIKIEYPSEEVRDAGCFDLQSKNKMCRKTHIITSLAWEHYQMLEI